MSKFVSETDLQTVDLGDGDWAKIPKKISFGFLMDLNIKPDDPDLMAKQVDLLTGLVKEWNLKDEQGQLVPVSREAILRLDTPTAMTLMKSLEPLMNVDPKGLKASSELSTERPTTPSTPTT